MDPRAGIITTIQTSPTVWSYMPKQATTKTSDLLSELTRRGGSVSPTFTRKLAESLGWDEEPQRLRSIPIPVPGLTSLFEGRLAEETAVLFVGHKNKSSSDLVNVVGQLAYHRSVEWGVISNRVETVIFNSHRVRDGTFVRAHVFDGNASRIDALLKALTPQEVLRGSLDKVVSQQGSDRLLVPIDDALVEALDRLRDDAMRHAKWSDKIDYVVHQVFSQFFILRAIEDRKIDPVIPPLQSALRRDKTLDENILNGIIKAARTRIQKDLFGRNASSELAPTTVARIIMELYEPPHLRAIGAKYHFQWVGADVLGRAYEKYLSTVLEPRTLEVKQRLLFDNPRRDVARHSIRKYSGIFYTPRFLVNFMTARAVRQFYSVSSVRETPPCVADIACGSGSFLMGALDVLQEEHLRINKKKLSFKDLVTSGRIFGIDLDERAVLLAQLSVWLKLAEEPEPLPLPELKDFIRTGDSLEESLWKSVNKQFDVLVGNPPFVASEKIINRAKLAKHYVSAQGRFDLAYIFVERCLTQMNPKAVLSLVVPNRLFGNRDSGTIRKLIAETVSLNYVVNFGSLEVFSGISAYIGVFMASRPSGEQNQPVRVIQVRDLPDRFQGAFLSLAASGESSQDAYGMKAFDSTQPTGEEPWNFMGREERKSRVRLEDASRPLAEVAQVRQGIKSGANDVFVVEIENTAKGIAVIRNGFGDVEEIETDLLKPVVFGSAIKGYRLPDDTSFLIYPYDQGRVISTTDMKGRFPRTFAYLDKNRADLALRSGFEGTGKQWYELTRERSRDWLEAPKLIMRDLAPSTQFAPDKEGGTFLIGGTAVVPADEHDLLPLLGFLNSAVANWQLRRNAPAFRGSFFKIEPQHLEGLNMPVAILEDSAVRLELCKAVIEVISLYKLGQSEIAEPLLREIDKLVAQAAGLSIEDLD